MDAGMSKPDSAWGGRARDLGAVDEGSQKIFALYGNPAPITAGPPFVTARRRKAGQRIIRCCPPIPKGTSPGEKLGGFRYGPKQGAGPWNGAFAGGCVPGPPDISPVGGNERWEPGAGAPEAGQRPVRGGGAPWVRP